MKKVYIAPNTDIVKVHIEGSVCGNPIVYSVDPTGDHSEQTSAENKDLPDGVEVGAKGDIWSGGVGIWED